MLNRDILEFNPFFGFLNLFMSLEIHLTENKSTGKWEKLLEFVNRIHFFLGLIIDFKNAKTLFYVIFLDIVLSNW